MEPIVIEGTVERHWAESVNVYPTPDSYYSGEPPSLLGELYELPDRTRVRVTIELLEEPDVKQA